MSRTGAPFLLILTLLLSLAVAAQTVPQPATPQSPTPQASTPQAATPQAAPPAASTPQTQATPAPGVSSAEPSPQEQARQTLDKVSADLSLTADQRTKLEPILISEIQLVKDLRADTTMTPDQKQAKFKEAMTSDHSKIEAILTPEQKQKLTQLRQQQAQQQQGSSQSAPSTPPSAQPQTPPKP